MDTVDLIDRVDSPELSRAPEETSANNSVNADISATAPTSTEIDEQESRQGNLGKNWLYHKASSQGTCQSGWTFGVWIGFVSGY